MKAAAAAMPGAVLPQMPGLQIVGLYMKRAGLHTPGVVCRRRKRSQPSKGLMLGEKPGKRDRPK